MLKIWPFYAPDLWNTSDFGSFFFSFPPDSSPEAIFADNFREIACFEFTILPTRAKVIPVKWNLLFHSDVTCCACPARMPSTDAAHWPHVSAGWLQHDCWLSILPDSPSTHPLTLHHALAGKINKFVLSYRLLRLKTFPVCYPICTAYAELHVWRFTIREVRYFLVKRTEWPKFHIGEIPKFNP